MSKQMQQYANRIRKQLFETIYKAGGGHFGGTLSIVEILTVIYNKFLRYDPKDPNMATRDRLILAKGHGGPALYVILADKEFFPEEWLNGLDKGGGHLPKHVDRLKVPGIDYSSGPLGQGLSVAAGIAAAAKLDGSGIKVYVILGDGECDEGQVWEAAMTAAKYKLDNIIVIVDRNECQIDGRTDEVMDLEPFAQKWQAFGWSTMTIDGHDTDEIEKAIQSALKENGKPCVIIADTKKGKGVSFMEDNYVWHSGSISEAQFQTGIADLEGCDMHD